MAFLGKEYITQRISVWYRDWQNNQASKFGAAPSSNAEIDTMAADVGLSCSDFRTLAARSAHAADLLPCRLRLFGLNPKEVREANPVLYRDMERLCSGCTRKSHCKCDLNRTFLSRAAYCPNEATMRELISDQGVRLN